MDRWKSTARNKLRQGESQKREDAGARKGRKVAKRCVFLRFCGSGGSKSRLAKAADTEPAGQMKDKKIARHGGEKTHLEVKSAKKLRGSEHVWIFACGTVHGSVARSTF